MKDRPVISLRKLLEGLSLAEKERFRREWGIVPFPDPADPAFRKPHRKARFRRRRLQG